MLQPLREPRLEEGLELAWDGSGRVRTGEDQVDAAGDLVEGHLALAAVEDEVVEAEGLAFGNPDEPTGLVLLERSDAGHDCLLGEGS